MLRRAKLGCVPALSSIPLTSCLAVVASLVAGCGSGGDSEDASTEARPAESAERVGDLPQGWETISNDTQGFEIGAPPGWGEGEACGPQAPAARGGTTLLCSPDRLVTVNVSVDRTSEALDLSPDESATRMLEAISAQSFEGKLEPAKPRLVKGHYDGASVESEGRSGDLRQTVEVVVLQREQLAAISAVIAANAEENAEAGVKLAEQALGTLRTQPVGSG